MKKTRKTKSVADELKKAQQAAEQAAARLEEVKLLNDAAIEEERQQMEGTEKQINDLCNETYFCGVILSHQDILAILSLALENKENIQIPFKLYNI